MYLECVSGGFGLLCIADEAKPSESTDSESLCSGWLGKKLSSNHAWFYPSQKPKFIDLWFCPFCKGAVTGKNNNLFLLSELTSMHPVVLKWRYLHGRFLVQIIVLCGWLCPWHPCDLGSRSPLQWRLREPAQRLESPCWLITISISVDPTTAADLRQLSPWLTWAGLLQLSLSSYHSGSWLPAGSISAYGTSRLVYYALRLCLCCDNK